MKTRSLIKSIIIILRKLRTLSLFYLEMYVLEVCSAVDVCETIIHGFYTHFMLFNLPPAMDPAGLFFISCQVWNRRKLCYANVWERRLLQTCCEVENMGRVYSLFVVSDINLKEAGIVWGYLAWNPPAVHSCVSDAEGVTLVEGRAAERAREAVNVEHQVARSHH